MHFYITKHETETCSPRARSGCGFDNNSERLREIEGERHRLESLCHLSRERATVARTSSLAEAFAVFPHPALRSFCLVLPFPAFSFIFSLNRMSVPFYFSPFARLSSTLFSFFCSFGAAAHKNPYVSPLWLKSYKRVKSEERKKMCATAAAASATKKEILLEKKNEIERMKRRKKKKRHCRIEAAKTKKQSYQMRRNERKVQRFARLRSTSASIR